MKKLNSNQLKSMKAGVGHYHWKCSVNGFVSKNYASWESAAKGAERHTNNYHTHANRITVYYCEKNH